VPCRRGERWKDHCGDRCSCDVVHARGSAAKKRALPASATRGARVVRAARLRSARGQGGAPMRVEMPEGNKRGNRVGGRREWCETWWKLRLMETPCRKNRRNLLGRWKRLVHVRPLVVLGPWGAGAGAAAVTGKDERAGVGGLPELPAAGTRPAAAGTRTQPQHGSSRRHRRHLSPEGERDGRLRRTMYARLPHGRSARADQHSGRGAVPASSMAAMLPSLSLAYVSA